ncbi:MAG: hypothetical protein AAGJ31_16035, partial [Verrucomicrobiota bacterium]
VRIALTELGISLKPKGDLVVSRLREVVEDGLTAKEVEAVKSGLTKMIENMHACTSSNDGAPKVTEKPKPR